MSLLGEKCVRCGIRTRHKAQDKPLCEPCERALQLAVDASKEATCPCPKDGATLVKEVAHGTIIDRCPSCRGVWLDAGELERLSSDVAQEVCAAMAFGARPSF
jgi:hypothetical protein